ncbi:unnamed protein product [marine sediment metagenome]|uniref:Uncharacterized protein n=1 Tax=marine sediment metagenome TaxID=412755 RepID=X1TG47_9ZZZZ
MPMQLVRKGQCSNCGACCKPPVIVENPCIELHEDRCKFYVDELNDQMYGHCLIFGRGEKDVEQVRDRYGKKITESQERWFNDNCLDYPIAEDLEAGRCPPECSFRFEVVTDG